jgi:phosphomevalonate kinase
MTKQIILLSGKRFSGKSSVCNILDEYYKLINKTYCNISFSYSLKKTFCNNNNLDFDKFMNSHEYKNMHRDALTAYFKTTDPIIYANAVQETIDNSDCDVIIIDDLRLMSHLIFMKNNNHNIKILRINSNDTSKEERGWIKSEYDNELCENDLDNYTDFDIIINNNLSQDDLKLKIISHINDT